MGSSRLTILVYSHETCMDEGPSLFECLAHDTAKAPDTTSNCGSGLLWAFGSTARRGFTLLEAISGETTSIRAFVRGVASADILVTMLPAELACEDSGKSWLLDLVIIARAMGISRIFVSVSLEEASGDRMFQEAISSLKPVLAQNGVTGTLFMPICPSFNVEEGVRSPSWHQGKPLLRVL